LDVSTIFCVGLFGLTLAGATFAGCRWHFGRRMRAAMARMEKLEHSRQTSMQHAQQARRQVEALQKELAAQREGRTTVSGSHGSPRNREAMEATLEQEAATREANAWASTRAASSDGFQATQIDAPKPAVGNGFADTLPMCVRPPNLA